MMIDRKRASLDAVPNKNYFLTLFSMPKVPQNTLLPFLTCSEQKALITCRETAPIIKNHLQETILNQIKRVVACLTTAEVKNENPSAEQIAQQELILNDATIHIHEKCKRIFICLDSQLNHYLSRLVTKLCRDDDDNLGKNGKTFFKSDEFILLNLFLKNKALTNALTTTNQKLVKHAGRFVAPPILESIVSISAKRSSDEILYSTGVIIEKNNTKYILTTTHSVDDTVTIEVRLPNTRRKYTAQKLCASNQSDLAILQVLEPEFNCLAQPALLGKALELDYRVKTVSVRCGILRQWGTLKGIDTDVNATSDLDKLPDVQIAMAHSEGSRPVFADSQVIGMTHYQEEKESYRITSMIPMSVIEHFLNKIFSNKKQGDFSRLPLVVQPQSETKPESRIRSIARSNSSRTIGIAALLIAVGGFFICRSRMISGSFTPGSIRPKL